MKGEAYLSRVKDPDGKVTTKEKGARQMGPKCTSPYCSKSKARRCNDISEDDKKSMFDSFWTKLDWNQRKTFVASLQKEEKSVGTAVDRVHFSITYASEMKGFRCVRQCL